MTPSMEMNVRNGPVTVGSIRVVGISSSSSLLVGDTESLTLYSYFDTPPESVIVGPLAPLPALPEEETE
ncbi:MULTISPECIES: spore gernimation protein GerPD [Cohnella]|uniref:spore gernimation protein GerPD n=1 Tax=Cohnella TaxID=329857 RepID=UPI0023DD9E71|nr:MULTISPECIES: spore gernimation protein GerPD [Cohnella]